jgi:hypothetical protein
MRAEASRFQAHASRAAAAHRVAQASGQRAQMAIALGEIGRAQIATCVDGTREMREELVQMVQGLRGTRQQV